MTQISRRVLVPLVLILAPAFAAGGQKTKHEADGGKRQLDQQPPRITLRLAVPRALPMVDRDRASMPDRANRRAPPRQPGDRRKIRSERPSTV